MDDLKATYVRRWLIKAGNDLRTAQAMIGTDPPVTDTACFHTQQCVEKCLKAFLVQADVHVEKTHYLRRLVTMCAEIDTRFHELIEIAISLTDYAVADRYPDDWREIPLEEAIAAVRMAEQAVEFVAARLAR